MLAYSDVVRDGSGYDRPVVAGAQVYLLNADDTLAAADKNPVLTDDKGVFTFTGVPDGVYFRDIRFGGVSYARDSVIVGNPPQYIGLTGPANNTYNSYTALLASDPTRQYAYLVGDTDTPPRPNGAYSNPTKVAGAWVLDRERAAVPYAVPYNRITSDRAMDRITVRDFGEDNKPVGAGNADWDTAGFKRALDFMANYRTQTITPGGGSLYTGPALHVPRGEYTLTGSINAGVPAAERCLFRGDGVNATVIKNADNTYFFDTNARLESTYLGHLTIVGGLGAFRQTRTDYNVGQNQIIEDCLFLGYTGTAISSESVDMPYWLIQRCFFAGGLGIAGQVRGICLGGLLDCLDIQQNRFLSNDYHIVIGPVASGSWHITNNDLISQYVPDRTNADIWIRPNDGRPTPAGALFRTEAGNGSSIIGNKFGNEGVTSFDKAAPRILIAAAQESDYSSPPPARGLAVPALTWKDGSDGRHYLSGVTIDANRFATASTTDAGGVSHDGPGGSLMRVYAAMVDRITWGVANAYDGGSYEYIVEHVDGGSRLPGKGNTNWNASIPSAGAPTRKGFTNSPIGHVIDHSGTDTSPYSIVPGTPPDSADILLTTATTPGAWGISGAVTKAAATNFGGANTATLFTFSGGAAAISYDTGPAGPFTGKVGRAGFIRGRYKLDGASAKRFIAAVNTAGRNILEKPVTLQPAADWMTVTIPITWPIDAIYNLFTLTGVDMASGDKLTLGDFKFVAGKAPPAL